MLFTFFYWISFGSISMGFGFIAGYILIEQLIHHRFFIPI